MFKIRYKLLLVMLGISLVPQLVINQISLKQIEATISAKFDREADFAAKSIQRYMQDTLSKNERNIISMERNIEYMYGEDLKVNKADMQQLVRVVQESSGSTPNFYIGTAEGEMFIYPDDVLPAGYDPRLRSWYQMAMLSKDSVTWFGPYIDQGTKQLVLTVAKYYEYKGKEGVIGIDIELTSMREQLMTEVLGQKGEMFIVDSLGEILLHDNPSFEGLNLKYTKYIEEGASKALETGAYQGDKFALKSLKLSDSLYVITVVDKEEIQQLVDSQMNTIRTVPFIFIVLTFGIILFFSDRLTRPLYMLIEAMKRTGKGDFDVQIDYKGNDEIMLLMQQYNQMSAGLRSAQEEMTALYEELSASEETLQEQYDELYNNRDLIAASERRYKLIFEASSEGLWEFDHERQLKHYSPNWFKNYFTDMDVKPFEDWTMLIHPDDQKRFMESIERHLNHQTPYFLEVYRVRDLKGQYRLIQSRGKAEFNPEGQLITLAGSHLDVTEQKHNEEQILKMAFFDQVTELANRRNFEREMDRYFENHQWGRIIYIDIATFKDINETYGYLVGDEVLKDLAQRLKATFKEAFVARVAGDEFAVVLEGLVNEDQLDQTLEALRKGSCCILRANDLAVDYRLNMVQCKFPNEGKNTEEIFASLLNKMKAEKNKDA